MMQGEASGSQQQQQQQQKLYIGGMSNLSVFKKKELRTELQLGLPGSPPGDDFGGAAMQLKPHNGLVNSTTPHNNNNNNSVNNRNNSSNNMNLKSSEDDKEKEGARPRGTGAGSSSSSSSCHVKQGDESHDCVDKHEDATGSQSRAPVGWPPVQSFRKNSLNAPMQQAKSAENPSSPAAVTATATTTTTTTGAGTSSQQPNSTSSQFVKVYMDGVPIGRKVNLRTHSSYERLSITLEEMFRRFISGQSTTNKAMKDKLLSESKKFNFIYGSDYVLTYEDKDGDLMLVGDVPWLMFVGTVKRLRIMKGSEAIGLAPREHLNPAK